MAHEAPDDLAQFVELMRHEQVVGRAPADPALRRRRRRRGLIAGAVAVAVVLALAGGYVGVTLTAPVADPVAVLQQPDVTAPPAVEIALPADGEMAISIAGADDYLGSTGDDIWTASGGRRALPMASISKLITALVVLSARPLKDATDPGPTLAFDKADHALYDKYYLLNATIAPMPTGSSMSLHDALETMLVVSACNYAEAVADWAFGSQAAFLGATRKWLAAHGLDHTTMVEPVGIDARNVSTPADLIALGRLAMANPAIAEIVGMTSLDVPSLPGMSNTNSLLGVDGITGIKTGTLGGSSNLLFSATLPVGLEEPLAITGVVLGGDSRSSVNAEVRALLESIKSGFHRVQLGVKGQVVGTYSTRWGASARAVLGESASLLTWSDTPITAVLTIAPLATGSDGDTIGSVSWTAGTSTVTAPVVLEGDLEPPSASWRLTHPFDLGK